MSSNSCPSKLLGALVAVVFVLAACGENGAPRTLPAPSGSGGGAGGGPGVRLPERWSGRVAVPPVGPGGSPRAKGLPPRGNPTLAPMIFRLKLTWETPRATNPAGYIQYGWIERHLTQCTTLANGTFVVTVARDVNGRAQEASLSFPATDIEKGEGIAKFSVALPQGIAVRAETGDTLKSDLRAADEKSFNVKLERNEGRVVGTFEGRVEGELTKEGFKAEGAFSCEPTP